MYIPSNGHEPFFVCGGELPLGFQLPQDFIIYFGIFCDLFKKIDRNPSQGKIFHDMQMMITKITNTEIS